MVTDDISEGGRRSPIRILLVDDDRDTAMALWKWFEYNHYKVDLFADPKTALSQFSANLYRLAIIDYKMYGLSRFGLYERLTAIDPALKVCFVTGYDVSGPDEFRRK